MTTSRYNLTHFGQHEGIALSALMIALVMLPLGTWAYGQNVEAKLAAQQDAQLAALKESSRLQAEIALPSDPEPIRIPSYSPIQDPNVPTPRALPTVRTSTRPTPKPTFYVVPLITSLPTLAPMMNILTKALPTGQVNTPYSAVIKVQNQYSSAPTMTTTRLPDGLVAQGCLESIQIQNDVSQSVCVIGGTPRFAGGPHTFTVTFTTPHTSQSVSQKYSLTITP